MARIKRIRAIQPCAADIFCHWVTEVGVIQRTEHREERLDEDARYDPLFPETETIPDRYGLESEIEDKERNNNIFRCEVHRIADCYNREEKDKECEPVGDDFFHRIKDVIESILGKINLSQATEYARGV